MQNSAMSTCAVARLERKIGRAFLLMAHRGERIVRGYSLTAAGQARDWLEFLFCGTLSLDTVQTGSRARVGLSRVGSEPCGCTRHGL